MNRLYRLFLDAARREPRRPVLCGRPGAPWMRFTDLRARAERLGASLSRAGLRRGDVVMAAIGNRPAFFVAALGVWSRGAVLLPVEESLSDAEIESLREMLRPAAGLACRGGRPALAFAGGVGSRHPGAAMIRLTSGTTGAPRGVVVTAGQLIADARAIIARTGLSPRDVNLGVAPLDHTYGFVQCVLPLILQGTPVLALRRPLPSLIFTALRSRRPMVLAAVPYIIDLLCRHPEQAPRRTGLRLVLSAGAPLPRRTADAFRARIGLGVRTLYGTSETGAIASDDSPDASAPEGCVGRPLPGVRVAVDRRGLERMPRGEGRVVVWSRGAARGYTPRLSSDLGDGRFRTADLGRLDDEGRLHLTGRVSFLVNVAGRKVNPSEVERALLALPSIADAAAMGVGDALRGERLEAWVVTRDGARPAEIREALSERLSLYKLPRAIHLVEAIPRTPRGKIDRVRLLALP